MSRSPIIWGLAAGLSEALFGLWPALWPSLPWPMVVLLALGRRRWSLRALTVALAAAVLTRELLSGGPWGQWLLSAGAALGANLLLERFFAGRGGGIVFIQLAAASAAFSIAQIAIAVLGGASLDPLIRAAFAKTFTTIGAGWLIYAAARLLKLQRYHA